MRAASLKLSVDPARGEAWIIPYKDKASFQLGYKGVYELAMRTNQYRIINVVDIYEGEELIEDRMTGIHTIGGSRTGDKVIAMMLYFRLFNGFDKTFVMTIPEIEAHAKTYSQSYNYDDSPWNAHNGRERMKMMRKTVLVNGLRKWGRFNAGDKEIVESIESDQEWHENVPDENTVTVIPDPIKAASNDDLLGMMGVESEHVDNPEIKPAADRPYTPAALKVKLAEFTSTKSKATDDDRNMVAANLNMCFQVEKPDQIRHAVLKYLTGKASTKDISDGTILALKRWLHATQDSGGEWKPDPMSVKEAQSVWTEAQKADGQEEIPFS
jgi:recombinational DNA repair protein RecT